MPEEDAANPELTPAVMQSMGAEALARTVAHLAGLGTQPARGDVDAEAFCRAMREGPPEYGTEPTGSVAGVRVDVTPVV